MDNAISQIRAEAEKISLTRAEKQSAKKRIVAYANAMPLAKPIRMTAQENQKSREALLSFMQSRPVKSESKSTNPIFEFLRRPYLVQVPVLALAVLFVWKSYDGQNEFMYVPADPVTPVYQATDESSVDLVEKIVETPYMASPGIDVSSEEKIVETPYMAPPAEEVSEKEPTPPHKSLRKIWDFPQKEFIPKTEVPRKATPAPIMPSSSYPSNPPPTPTPPPSPTAQMSESMLSEENESIRSSSLTNTYEQDTTRLENNSAGTLTGTTLEITPDFDGEIPEEE
jgi:hypothetical protein